MTTILADPKWLAIAKKYVGLREIPGPRHNPVIVGWMKDLSNGAIDDDETAWCAAYTGAVLQEAGLKLPSNPLSARAYLELPMKLDRPAVGAVAIYWRGSKSGWQGHVGFVGGKDQNGNVVLLSGNADNMVKWGSYDNARLLGYRWPSIAPLAERYNLPLLTSTGRPASEA